MSGELDRLVARHVDGKASAAAFGALAEYMKPDEMIEATVLIGFYIMTSAFLQTFDILLEDA